MLVLKTFFDIVTVEVPVPFFFSITIYIFLKLHISPNLHVINIQFKPLSLDKLRHRQHSYWSRVTNPKYRWLQFNMLMSVTTEPSSREELSMMRTVWSGLSGGTNTACRQYEDNDYA